MLDETPEAGRASMDTAKAIINTVLTSDLSLSSDEERSDSRRNSKEHGGERDEPPSKAAAADAAAAAGAAEAAPSSKNAGAAADREGARASAVAAEAAIRVAASSGPVPIALPPNVLEPTSGAETSSGGSIRRNISASKLSGSNDTLPQFAVSPLIDAITSDERGDCSLLRGAEMSLRQLGNPREALHQVSKPSSGNHQPPTIHCAPA